MGRGRWITRRPGQGRRSVDEAPSRAVTFQPGQPQGPPLHLGSVLREDQARLQPVTRRGGEQDGRIGWGGVPLHGDHQNGPVTSNAGSTGRQIRLMGIEQRRGSEQGSKRRAQARAVSLCATEEVRTGGSAVLEEGELGHISTGAPAREAQLDLERKGSKKARLELSAEPKVACCVLLPHLNSERTAMLHKVLSEYRCMPSHVRHCTASSAGRDSILISQSCFP